MKNMSTANPPLGEEEKSKKTGGEGERKRKRPKPPPCRCVATVRHINCLLHDLHEFASEKIYNFPELTGKIVEKIEKALRDEIVHPIELIERQLVEEEKIGKRDQLEKLEKSRICKATRLHDPFDIYPAIDGTSSVCYASDQEIEDGQMARW